MNKRKGFSLLEVIFALAIITITFVAVASLVSRNLQSNLLNQSYITANYLNEEAVEIMRNMRDSNWLQNYSFNANSEKLWGVSLWPRGGSKSIVQVDRRTTGEAPWIMRSTSPSSEANKLYLAENNKGQYFTHSGSGEPTRFSRYVELEVMEGHKINQYEELPPLKITAITMFDINGRIREVRYTTVLTDWKQGPL